MSSRLLLPETNAEQARSIAERWARDFRAAPVGVAADLTMSVGVCDLIHAGGSRELLRLADNALYHAKARGRDTIVVYSPDAVPDISDTDRADRLERMQAFTAIRSLARLIDAKEPMAEHHSERVATFVQPLAEAAGWPLARIAELADAALIHDVGKISVPEDVLRKPAALTPAEYEGSSRTLRSALRWQPTASARSNPSGSRSTTSGSMVPAIRTVLPTRRSRRAPLCSR